VTQPRSSQIRKLFDACLDLPAGERDSYLQATAAGDAGLVKEVQSLLAAHVLAESDDPIGAAIERQVDRLKPAPLPPLETGRKLADFVIVRKLGSGGFGDVYLASQYSLGRNVALKLSRADSPEARTMARLRHPNIVQVYSAMRLDEIEAAAICMQYVAGVTLAELLDFVATVPNWDGRTVLDFIDGAVPSEDASGGADRSARARFESFSQAEVIAHVTMAIGNALAYAHATGVLHLDVKPSNILIDRSGEALLMDFNVSLRRDRPGEARLGGTPDFMAPEHIGIAHGTANRDDLDGRADIFSLGVVMQRLLARTKASPERRVLEELAARCVQPDRTKRFAGGALLVEACDRRLRLLNLARQLDREQDWFLYRMAMRWPRLTVMAALIIPNAVASAFQIYYNQVHILGHFTAGQLETFTSMLLPSNAVIYTAGFAAIFYFYWSFFRIAGGGLGTIDDRCDDGARSAARRALVTSPYGALRVITALWTAGCVDFLIGLHYFGGGLTPAAIHHFMVSFLLAMAIPLAFCLLAVGYINIGVFYPHLLADVLDLRGVVARDTAKICRSMKSFRFLAGAVPLAGAVVVVIEGPGANAGGNYPYQNLVVAFICTGLVGSIFAVSVVDRFTAVMTRLEEAVAGFRLRS
jgi:serine/threonine protein kinase